MKQIEKNSFGREEYKSGSPDDVLEKALIFHYRGRSRRLCAVAFLTSFAKYFFGLRS